MQIAIATEFPVACESPDHLMPWGTRHDNSVNRRFNRRVWSLYPQSRARVLDIGCSGGGFVRTCLDDGHFAVGLEGSDYSRKHRRAEWRAIPEFLFTADGTKPFSFSLDGAPLWFDVITSWEFIEHINEQDLPGLFLNVKAHLQPGGLWILSVANHSDVINGVELHQTQQPREWWRATFRNTGLVELEQHRKYFSPQFVRGARRDSETSFHFVLTNDETMAPRIPKLPHGWLDHWIGSTPQKMLNKLVTGA